MIAIVLSLVFAAAAPVELRGGVTLDEPVVEVSVEGVLLGGDSPRMIGWDRARLVFGEHAEAAAAFADLAEDAWRARIRLSRGDLALAEPLFERLYDTYRDLDGPTALVVAEGLMRCRIARGDMPGAIDPWLTALRLRRSGQRLVGEPPIPPLIDDATGLVPTLAPIFSATRADVPIWAGGWDGDLAALARWYATALTGAPAPPMDADTPGLGLVAHVVLARSERPSDRTTAQEWLAARLAVIGGSGGWEEAWARCALGLSLLADGQAEREDEALLHLSHLPARFRTEQPTLTGVALAAMIECLERRGDTEQAAALAIDLQAVDPDHPALRHGFKGAN